MRVQRRGAIKDPIRPLGSSGQNLGDIVVAQGTYRGERVWDRNKLGKRSIELGFGAMVK